MILTYVNGFQVWDITNLQNVRELISKKEGPIKIVKVNKTCNTFFLINIKSFLKLLVSSYSFKRRKRRKPSFREKTFIWCYVKKQKFTILKIHLPIILFQSSSADSSSTFPNTMLQFYSLVTNEYVNKLKFKTEIYGFNCNRRTLVIVMIKEKIIK